MESVLNYYHKKIKAIKLQLIASWRKLNLSHKERLNKLNGVWEQQFARKSKSFASESRTKLA